MPNQVTYTGMLWLLVAQCVVMLPFTLHLPLWLIPVMIFSAGWRLRVLGGGLRQPGTPTKVALLAAGVGGLLVSGLKFPSLDAMASLLLLGFAFKALEVIKKRDALVVVFSGYFLVALYFLYNQSILAGLYGLLSILMLTSALISIQQTVPEWSAKQQIRFNLRTASLLVLQSLPLMVLIFMLVPRLPPLWSLPMNMGQAKTGMSDRMAPGEIGKLSQSGELAFRVSFNSQRPAQKDLYWRGLVLNHFDGHEWRQFEHPLDRWELKGTMKGIYRFDPSQVRLKGEPINYEIVFEKTGQPWLFTLSPVINTNGDVYLGADYRVMAQQDLQSAFLLNATSYPDALRDVSLSPYLRDLALQLPRQGDTRARALVQQWRQAGATDAALVEKALQHYRSQNFFYTLQPPRLTTADTIDEFLFDTQRGFCEHYAGSFVFLMRAAGIPARVVAGYQGGEWNDNGHYLLVHQYDAHAWAEVWLPEQGWVQIDPTAAVAPERVELGMQAAMRDEASFLEGRRFAAKHLPWLNQISLRLDALQYNWQRWVLSYDDNTRLNLLESILGSLSVGRMLSGIALFLGLMILLWLFSLGLLKRPPRQALEQRYYQQFCALLAKQGLQRASGQTPGDFAQQAALVFPQQAEVIQQFTQAYERVCYQLPTHNAEAMQQLKQAFARLKAAFKLGLNRKSSYTSRDIRSV